MSTAKEERRWRKQRLTEYRREQRQTAIARDEGRCMCCRWLEGLDRPACQVHHVFGRGNWEARETYEHHNRLLCLCARHHGDFHDRGLITQEQMEWVLSRVTSA